MVKSRELLHDNDIINIGNFRIQYLATVRSTKKSRKHEETTAMSLDAMGLPGTTGALQASLKVLSGSSAGLEMPVVKAVTTFGQPGVAVVSISHRRDGYYVAHMDGTDAFHAQRQAHQRQGDAAGAPRCAEPGGDRDGVLLLGEGRGEGRRPARHR
jgi:hypothetical protein